MITGSHAEEGKIHEVTRWLQEQFPEFHVDHMPEPDNIADQFRILTQKRPRVVHAVRVGRSWFDRYDAVWKIQGALQDQRVAPRMREAGAGGVELD